MAEGESGRGGHVCPASGFHTQTTVRLGNHLCGHSSTSAGEAVCKLSQATCCCGRLAPGRAQVPGPGSKLAPEYGAYTQVYMLNAH